MEFVLINWIAAIRNSYKGLPHVVQRNDLVIAIPRTTYKIVFIHSRVIRNAVVPANSRRIDCKGYNGIERCNNMVIADVVNDADCCSAAVREIDGIRHVVGVGIVIHEEVVDAVIEVSVSVNRMDKLVNVEMAHEAQIWISIAAVMDDVGLV